MCSDRKWKTLWPFHIANLTFKTLSLSHIILFKCSYFASTSDLRYTVKVSVSSWGLRRFIFLSWSKSLRKVDKEFSVRKGTYCSNLTFMSGWWATILILLICCTKKVKLSTSNRTDKQHEACHLEQAIENSCFSHPEV